MAMKNVVKPKPAFAAVSTETLQRIEDSDKANALAAAAFRFADKSRELEAIFNTRMAELRRAYLQECIDIHGGDEGQ